MSDPKDGEQGRVKETKRCLYCGDIMQEAQMPGCPPYTKGFVCSKCGFIAFSVGTHERLLRHSNGQGTGGSFNLKGIRANHCDVI